MKQILILAFAIISMACKAQDKIVFHNGKTAEGKVSEVTEQYVKFVYKGEEANNVIGTAAISDIEFASGRVQHITDKVIVEYPEDWENVVVVYDKNQVVGLKSLGKIEKHSNGAWSFHNATGHFMEKALKKAKKEAAKKAACYILVVNQSNTARAGFSSYSDSSIICELYTY